MSLMGIHVSARIGLRGAVIATLFLAASATFAVENGAPAAVTPNPVIVYTDDAAVFRANGPAAQLLARARDEGEINVIISLRTTMRMEHTLSSSEATAQRARLRGIQDRVAERVLGAASALDDADRFSFIPAMAMRVGPAQLRRLLADPEVVSVHEDIPDVPLLGDSIKLIHADDVFAKGFNGTNRVVAVLDTGVDKTHPMLKTKVKSEACYSTHNPPALRSLCPGQVQQTTDPGSGKPCSIAGCDHGTHVASIAAGNSNKFDGVARDSNIIAIQVFSRNANNKPVSRERDQIRGLERVYALRDTYKIAAVNMSIGGGKYDAACDATFPERKMAIDNLRGAGIATTIATGNDSFTGFIGAPACISTAIQVGNTTKEDLIWRSSNHSSLVKLMAPGTGIKAAVPGDDYKAKTGTSMAAPHVAGAWALLRNAKPTATLDQILEALTCSGKTVHERFVTGGDPVELSPARPRIDLLGAFNFLKKPANATRTWNFSNVNQARDWAPFRGTWAISNGRYRQTPIMQGWIGSAVASCNTALEVVASMTRTDPGTTLFSNTGVFLKTTLDYATKVVSGYWFAYNKCRTNEFGTCTGEPEDPPGQAVVWRASNFNFNTNSGAATNLCTKQSSVNVNGLNTVKVISNGASHTFRLNGKLVCTVNDATYASGPVMAAAYIADAGGHAYQVDSFSVKPLDAGALPSVVSLMDPASAAPKPAPAGMSPLGSSPQ